MSNDEIKRILAMNSVDQNVELEDIHSQEIEVKVFDMSTGRVKKTTMPMVKYIKDIKRKAQQEPQLLGDDTIAYWSKHASDVKCVNVKDSSCLFALVAGGNFAALKMMFNKFKAKPWFDINARVAVDDIILQGDKSDRIKFWPGSTALFQAAFINNIQIVEYLLEQGADPNIARYCDGRSPLHIAASYGHVDVIRLLIQYGADVLKVTPDGQLPVIIALFKNHSESVLALVEGMPSLLDMEIIRVGVREGVTKSGKTIEYFDLQSPGSDFGHAINLFAACIYLRRLHTLQELFKKFDGEIDFSSLVDYRNILRKAVFDLGHNAAYTDDVNNTINIHITLDDIDKVINITEDKLINAIVNYPETTRLYMQYIEPMDFRLLSETFLRALSSREKKKVIRFMLSLEDISYIDYTLHATFQQHVKWLNKEFPGMNSGNGWSVRSDMLVGVSSSLFVAQARQVAAEVALATEAEKKFLLIKIFNSRHAMIKEAKSLFKLSDDWYTSMSSHISRGKITFFTISIFKQIVDRFVVLEKKLRNRLTKEDVIAIESRISEISNDFYRIIEDENCKLRERESVDGMVVDQELQPELVVDRSRGVIKPGVNQVALAASRQKSKFTSNYSRSVNLTSKELENLVVQLYQHYENLYSSAIDYAINPTQFYLHVNEFCGFIYHMLDVNVVPAFYYERLHSDRKGLCLLRHFVVHNHMIIDNSAWQALATEISSGQSKFSFVDSGVDCKSNFYEKYMHFSHYLGDEIVPKLLGLCKNVVDLEQLAKSIFVYSKVKRSKRVLECIQVIRQKHSSLAHLPEKIPNDPDIIWAMFEIGEHYHYVRGFVDLQIYSQVMFMCNRQIRNVMAHRVIDLSSNSACLSGMNVDIGKSVIAICGEINESSVVGKSPEVGESLARCL